MIELSRKPTESFLKKSMVTLVKKLLNETLQESQKKSLVEFSQGFHPRIMVIMIHPNCCRVLLEELQKKLQEKYPSASQIF